MGGAASRERRAVEELEKMDRQLLLAEAQLVADQRQIEKSEARAAANLRSAASIGTNVALMNQHAASLIRARLAVADTQRKASELDELRTQIRADISAHKTNALRRDLTKSVATLAISKTNDPDRVELTAALLRDSSDAIQRSSEPVRARIETTEIERLVAREREICTRDILESYGLSPAVVDSVRASLRDRDRDHN